jgi:hypothetical protein
MTRVTLASIAYVATQVNATTCHRHLSAHASLPVQARFALSSSPVFSRTDTATDSERFYNSVLDLLYDVDEQEEVNELIMWWNR